MGYNASHAFHTSATYPPPTRKQGGASSISDFDLRGGVLTIAWDWEGWPGSFYPDTVRERIKSLLQGRK